MRPVRTRKFGYHQYCYRILLALRTLRVERRWTLPPTRGERRNRRGRQLRQHEKKAPGPGPGLSYREEAAPGIPPPGLIVPSRALHPCSLFTMSIGKIVIDEETPNASAHFCSDSSSSIVQGRLGDARSEKVADVRHTYLSHANASSEQIEGKNVGGRWQIRPRTLPKPKTLKPKTLLAAALAPRVTVRAIYQLT
jgi:hypothetical protein